MPLKRHEFVVEQHLKIWPNGEMSYGIFGQVFSLISSFLSIRQLWVVLDGESSEEYPVNAGIHQGSILGPTFFLLYINDLPGDVISNTHFFELEKHFLPEPEFS